MALRCLYRRSCPLFTSVHLQHSQWRIVHLRNASTLASKKVFKQLDGHVDTTSEHFLKNLKKSEGIIAKFQQIFAAATGGGGEKAIERHTKRNKKLLAADRLRLLFDDYDDVLEIMPLAGIGMKYGDIPRAGILAAIGKIHGIHCLVIANDATVKAGTVFPISLAKQLRCLTMVEHNKLPCVFVVDSGGAFLPLQAEIFLPGGRTFYNEAVFNSMDIPQMAIVVGSCTAGAAYVPAMVQEAVIVKNIGTIFLGGPPLVKAALGEIISPEDLGGADVHCRESGVTDHYAETEQEAFETGRDIVASFNVEPVSSPEGFDEPLYDPAELLGIIPHKDQHTMDMYKVIARLTDGSRFQEFKAKYGMTLITGFAHIKGHLTGIIGNNGPITDSAALKGAHFVQMCDQRRIPIVFLQNSTPDTDSPNSVSSGIEQGCDLVGHSKFMSAVACCTVPKITLIVGNSFGATNYMMAGRSFDPRFMFCWPNAQICIMEPNRLFSTLTQDVSSSDLTEEQMKKLKEKTHLQSSALYSSGNVWDDGVILPQDSRKVLAQCLEIVSQRPASSEAQTRYNVMRI